MNNWQKIIDDNVEKLKIAIPRELVYKRLYLNTIIAMYFMNKWQEWVDIEEEIKDDRVKNYITELYRMERIFEDNSEG